MYLETACTCMEESAQYQVSLYGYILQKCLRFGPSTVGVKAEFFSLVP
jgi:hypothetical protein